jgi:hypothetical protein
MSSSPSGAPFTLPFLLLLGLSGAIFQKPLASLSARDIAGLLRLPVLQLPVLD